MGISDFMDDFYSLTSLQDLLVPADGESDSVSSKSKEFNQQQPVPAPKLSYFE